MSYDTSREYRTRDEAEMKIESHYGTGVGGEASCGELVVGGGVEGVVGSEFGGGAGFVVGGGADGVEGQLHAFPVQEQPLPRRHASSAEF